MYSIMHVLQFQVDEVVNLEDLMFNDF